MMKTTSVYRHIKSLKRVARNFLCKIGIHDYFEVYREREDFYYELVTYKCWNCNKIHKVSEL